jgi:hypothetical protein
MPLGIPPQSRQMRSAKADALRATLPAPFHNQNIDRTLSRDQRVRLQVTRFGVGVTPHQRSSSSARRHHVGASSALHRITIVCLFYRVQAILSGRVPTTAPRQLSHPDFPLRGFVRCESCGRGLTGSWSKGRSEYYAYYHCRLGCRAVNVSKAMLEGLFADELALLQPTPGYMRLLKESVLQIWKARKAVVREELANAERTAKAIRTSWTASTRHSSSSARSTSRRTTVTPRSCASSSRSRGWTVTQASSKNSM